MWNRKPSATTNHASSEELAVDNLIRHARAGDHAAIRDMVQLVKAGFHLKNNTPDNPILQALAQVRLSEHSTDEQKRLVESLRNPIIDELCKSPEVDNLILHVQAGEDDAIRDLVELVKAGFLLHNRTLVDPILQALAKVLLSEISTSEQKRLVESLQNPGIDEICESAKMDKLIRRARSGKDDAIKDLVEIVKADFPLRNQRLANLILDVLLHVLLSEDFTSEQKRLVESLRNPDIQAMHKSALADKLIFQAWAGNAAAISDLVELVKAGFLRNNACDYKAARALAKAFFSEHATREQRQLIWSLSDAVVYEDVWIEQESDSIIGPNGEHGTKTYTIERSKQYTFYEYILKYCPNETANLTRDFR